MMFMPSLVLEGNLGDLFALGDRERRKLSGRAQHNDTVGTVVLEPGEHIFERTGIEFQILVAGRDAGDPEKGFGRTPQIRRRQRGRQVWPSSPLLRWRPSCRLASLRVVSTGFLLQRTMLLVFYNILRADFGAVDGAVAVAAMPSAPLVPCAPDRVRGRDEGGDPPSLALPMRMPRFQPGWCP